MAIEDAEFQLPPEDVHEPKVIDKRGSDSPKPKLKGPLVARQPSEDELKAWEEKAGLAHETGKEQRSSTQRSEPFVSTASNVADVATVRASSAPIPGYEEGEGNFGTSTRRGAILDLPDPSDFRRNNRRPITTLGADVHRMIYAKHVAGAAASPEALEHHAKEWDSMAPTAQRNWQDTDGKESTDKAIAEHKATYVQGAGAVRDERYRYRENVRDLTFTGGSDARKAFEEQGTLARERKGRRIDYINNIDDPRQRDVAGEYSTQPEHNWRAAWQSGLTSRPEVGVGLGGDSTHHAALSAHIEDLSSRLPHGARPIKDSKGLPIASTAHAGESWFNQYGHIGAKGQVLQENQFLKPQHQELLSARRALAQSAKAHTLGMRDEALSYYRKAADHASNAADIIHANDRARGAQNGDVPVADWDKADRLVSNYRNSEAFK